VTQRVAILGGGALAREVLDIFDACNAAGTSYDVAGFIVEDGFGEIGTYLNGKPLLGNLDWFRDAGDIRAVCAVGYPERRRGLVERAKRRGVRFCNAIHPTAVLTRWMRIGEGVVIAAGCTFTNGITLADHVHVNPGCTIGHDVMLEELATLAPGVHLSGYVTVREGAFVGTGVSAIQRVTVGAWSIVGAGATLIEDVAPNTTVIGTPARLIRRRDPGWQMRI